MTRAFLFPGQGSQKVGMDAGLPRARFDEANAALGFDLAKLISEGPASELEQTAMTQPAILTVSIAIADKLSAAGIVADVALGHSLGEYSALVYAGALAFADAVRLVHLRGQFMQQAVPVGVGAMAAIIGLSADLVANICRESSQDERPSRAEGESETAPSSLWRDGRADERPSRAEGESETAPSSLWRDGRADTINACQPANFNGAGQVVISGHKAAVERAMALCKLKGAKLVKALPVSAPFHSALMAPAREKLREALERVTVSPLRIDVYANVTAAPNRDATRVKDLLVQQVTGSVRFEESVLHLANAGVTEAYEVGPGKVLSGLVKRIAPSIAPKEMAS